MVYELVSLHLMHPTDESCARIYLFGLHPRISSAIDNIHFSEQTDNIDVSLITSLEAGAIPRLNGDRVLVYLTTQLAKVLPQGYSSSIDPALSNLPYPNTRFVASSGKVDSGAMMGSMAPRTRGNAFFTGVLETSFTFAPMRDR